GGELLLVPREGEEGGPQPGEPGGDARWWRWRDGGSAWKAGREPTDESGKIRGRRTADAPEREAGRCGYRPAQGVDRARCAVDGIEGARSGIHSNQRND